MSIAVRSTSGVWGSRTTIVLALTASAIGLGNLWRFSYLLGENGGAPFLLVYLATLFLVGVPLLVAELLIGTHGRANPVSALLYASARSEITRGWVVLGWLMGITAMLVLAYYSVVAGWGLAYIQKLQLGQFADASAGDVGREFQALLDDPQLMVEWQTLFIIATFGVSALGIYRGLGVLFWLAVPLMLAILGVLVQFALEHGDMARAGQFLFSLNTWDFTAQSALLAVGQAFYTLGVGAGVGIAFGAYTPEKIPLGRTVIAVALFDTVMAVAAGLAIFPLIFAANMQPSLGPGLMFIGLPTAFGNMAQGELFGTLFFVLFSVTALTSAVALAEPAISYLVERMRVRRTVAALCCGGATWILALACALSFNLWQDLHWFGELTMFQALEKLTALILLPLGALLTAVLVGYRLRPDILRIELYRESAYFFVLWRFCLRYIAPPAILAIMVAALVEYAQ